LIGGAALAAAAGQAAFAVTADMDVNPRAVSVGESAICNMTVHGLDNPPPPSLPAVPGLQISPVGTERSWSMGPGGQDSSVSFRFRVLPLQAGKFSIGPIAYEAEGQRMDIPAVELEAVDQGAAATSDGGGSPIADLLFATISAQPTNVYIQQVFDVVLCIYSRNITLGRDVELGNMPASGLSLPPFQEMGSTREVVRNQIYDVRRFRCKAQALTAGAFTLEPNIRVQVVVPRDRRRMSPFDDLFNDPFGNPFMGRYQTQAVDLRAEPVVLNVQPLPPADGVPGFAGAVGRFAFDVQVKPTEVSAGEPVTLSMQIGGVGNIENISPPAIAAGPDFRLYEPRQVSRDIDGARSGGRVLYEQVVIPRSDTNAQLPALSFSYFDPELGRYETVTRGPFDLVVHPATNGAGRVIQAAADVPEARTMILGSDIVYLKPPPPRWPRPGNAPSIRAVFWGVQAVPALAVLGLFLAARRREQMSRDVARARRARAPRSARPALHRAEKALAGDRRGEFVDALQEALAAYLGNRLNLPAGAVTPDVIMARLEKSALPADGIARARDLLAFCERERYGQGSGHVEGDRALLAARLEGLRGILKACERVRL